MRKFFFNKILIDIPKGSNLLIVSILIGMIFSHAAWGRGGHSGDGSVIGGDGGGGGHGHSHFGGGHRIHGHSHHHHLGLGFSGFYGPGFFGPGFYGPGFYGYPYGYGYPGNFYPRYYTSPLVAPSAPTVYIERETPASTSAQPAQNNYWHYCRNPEGYYPYIKECPEGWLQVAPQPLQQ